MLKNLLLNLRTNKKIKPLAWLFIVLPIMAASLFLIQNRPFVIDEPDHYKTIEAIAELNITDDTFRRVPVFPGYHFTLGLLSYLFAAPSLSLARSLSTIFSFLSVLVFYLIAKDIEPQKAVTKTLQYFFFPLLFVFFFLVYTEPFSLLLVMLSFYFLTRGRYKTSGFFGLLSVLVRQNNIIWLGFFVLLIILEKHKQGFGKKQILSFLSDASIFIFSFGVLVAFVFWNKGFVLGDPGAHPLSIHFSNLFFFLLLHFFLFLPLNISHFPQLIKIIKRKPWIIFPVTVFFVFYIFAFKTDHPYNQSMIDYFLRNRLLSYVTRRDSIKAIFFIPIGYSIASLAVTQFHKKIYYLFYPFMVICLSLSWLVEPRYYLIPFSFFILFKKQKSPLIEYTTIIIFMALAGWIFWGTLNQKFFL